MNKQSTSGQKPGKRGIAMTNKRKGQIARYLSGAAFLFALGAVGGMDACTLTPAQGAGYMAAGLAVAAVAGMKGGLFR